MPLSAWFMHAANLYLQECSAFKTLEHSIKSACSLLDVLEYVKCLVVMQLHVDNNGARVIKSTHATYASAIQF